MTVTRAKEGRSVGWLVEWALGDQMAHRHNLVDRSTMAAVPSQWGAVTLFGSLLTVVDDEGRGPSLLPLVDDIHDPDALAVYAAIRRLLTGQREAMVLVRRGKAPDWMPGATPRAVPRDGFAKKGEAKATAIRDRHGNMVAAFTAIRWAPDPAEIRRARLAYLDWWVGMSVLADDLIASPEQLARFRCLPFDADPQPWVAQGGEALTVE